MAELGQTLEQVNNRLDFNAGTLARQAKATAISPFFLPLPSGIHMSLVGVRTVQVRKTWRGLRVKVRRVGSWWPETYRKADAELIADLMTGMEISVTSSEKPAEEPVSVPTAQTIQADAEAEGGVLELVPTEDGDEEKDHEPKEVESAEPETEN